MPDDDSTLEGDGSDNNGTSDSKPGVKTVPESDLIALKKTHGTELADLKTQLDTVTKEVVTERTAKEVVETRLSELPGLQESLVEARSSLDLANTSLAEAKTINEGMVTKALDQRREFLKTTHKLDDAKVKDLNESQLTALEAILPSVSKVSAPNGANLDILPSGGSGDSSNLSARDKIRQGVASRS